MSENRLIHESSPYLLQHAHNPVHWYPWSEEALTAARSADKPILVSIGYAACHWCHVMEKESFENEETAAVMNRFFICIKIDREERPDLDHIYMDAVQAISGSGGWPLNVFLTPEAKPFFGGTYFPPTKSHGLNSWTDVLLSIAHSWTERRTEIESQAEQLTEHIKKSGNLSVASNIITLPETTPLYTKEDCLLIAANLMKNADVLDGGFGKAPKFPQTFSIQYLLQHAHFFDDQDALKHAAFSLKKMLDGGIYDQLAGGMARYSTDSVWLAPHFEKMLYDNALLVLVLCDAYQLTKDPVFSKGIVQTLQFLMQEMKGKDGGYYAAIDADSEGVEGKFYVWEQEEIKKLLGDDADMYCRYYNVVPEGNWEEHNILYKSVPVKVIASSYDLSEKVFTEKIHACNATLLAARNKRIRPATDDKILLGWNALLLKAFSRAYATLQKDVYLEEAIGLEDFLSRSFHNKAGGCYHTYKDFVARFPAFLDDYAYYINALIALQEVTSDQSYLDKAKELTTYVLDHFADDEGHYFFYTHHAQQDVIARKQDVYDGATPSANSVMAHNLYYLSVIYNEPSWQTRSLQMLSSLSEVVKKYPGSFGVWAILLQQVVAGINELVVTGIQIDELKQAVLSEFIPNKIFLSSTKKNHMYLFGGKRFLSSSFVYLCRNYQCFAPFETLSELLTVLKKKV